MSCRDPAISEQKRADVGIKWENVNHVTDYTEDSNKRSCTEDFSQVFTSTEHNATFCTDSLSLYIRLKHADHEDILCHLQDLLGPANIYQQLSVAFFISEFH